MKISRYFIPILVLLAVFGGYSLRTAFTQPTTDMKFSAAGHKTVACTVEGLKCKGTATFFSSLYNETPGIASITTFATEHRAVIKYDPAMIGPERIREIMETPVPLRDGTSRQVFTCQAID